MDKNVLNLSGLWHAAADNTNGEGFYQGWYERGIPDMSRIPLTRRQQPNYIMLPGTTDEAHIGHAFNPGYELSLGLDRAYTWDNDMWLEKEITIPESFAGKQVELVFERTFYFSRVWVDGKPLGEYRSCATPHSYDATGLLTPGNHRITININALEVKGFGGHHMTPGSGAKWNGIIGYIELRAKDSVHISSIQCYPDVSHGAVKLKTNIKNHTDGSLGASIQWVVRVKETGALAASISSDVVLKPDENVFEREVTLSPVLIWDEFNPNLYKVEVIIKASGFEDRADCIFWAAGD